MSPRIEAEVSVGVWSAIEERRAASGEHLDRLVDGLLAEALELERHSLFQVSTSNALVQGLFEGVITVGDLRRHGDFGLGTFTGLDGEMVMIDGECFRATVGGAIDRADDAREVPFALVTRYTADIEETIEASAGLDELTGRIDLIRPSENLFVGVRVDGHFEHLSMRAACKALPGENLVEATGHQSEFDVEALTGSLVGFWSPTYSRAIGVPGYHFHFISEDRETGGHVLGLRAGRCRIGLHTESDLHLALPETADFLAADLSGDHGEELRAVESERRTVSD
jgi:acetolactate decarboxylase